MTPGGRLETPIGTYEWPQGYEDRVEEFTRIAVDGGVACRLGRAADRATGRTAGR